MSRRRAESISRYTGPGFLGQEYVEWQRQQRRIRLDGCLREEEWQVASSSITKYQSREIAIDVHCKQLAKVALVANRLFAEPFVQIFSKVCLWQQSDNVPFEQSRNVPLTVPGWWDGTRTTTDDAG